MQGAPSAQSGRGKRFPEEPACLAWGTMSSRGWRSPSKAPGQWAWHACLAGSILEHAPGLMHLTPGHHAAASHEDLVDISQHHRPFAALS